MVFTPGVRTVPRATLKGVDEEDLASFVEHCRAAIRIDHAGTFCHERLVALHEYRGEREEAASICRRVVELLEAVGDPSSATRFRKRLGRLES